MEKLRDTVRQHFVATQRNSTGLPTKYGHAVFLVSIHLHSRRVRDSSLFWTCLLFLYDRHSDTEGMRPEENLHKGARHRYPPLFWLQPINYYYKWKKLILLSSHQIWFFFRSCEHLTGYIGLARKPSTKLPCSSPHSHLFHEHVLTLHRRTFRYQRIYTDFLTHHRVLKSEISFSMCFFKFFLIWSLLHGCTLINRTKFIVLKIHPMLLVKFGRENKNIFI